MPVKSKRGVFPLHLTPFESYMFIDDHPRFPMTFVFQFDFLGEVDRTAFQESIDQALQRHPMLRTIIQPAKASRDCWVLAKTYDSKIDFGDFSDKITANGSSSFIDLRNEIGFKGWIRNDSERTRLVALFHHSAVDGIGAYHFLNDVFWFYAKRFGNQIGELRQYDEQQLRSRLRANVGKLVREAESLEPSFDKFKATPILPHRQTSVTTGAEYEFPQFQSHIFDKDEHRELRLQAQVRGQTLNDRLLESLMVCMLTWNEQHGGVVENDDFCVLMPLDLRTPEQAGLSAANVVTSSFIRRSADQIRDRKNLSSSLLRETMCLKHRRHESDFMKQLISSPINWNEAAKVYDENSCLTSTIFSNAGDPTKRFLNEFPKQDRMFKCGNLLLEEMNGSSPLRSMTRAAFNSFTYQRQMKIGIRCDPQFFSNSDGKALLDHFVHTFLNG